MAATLTPYPPHQPQSTRRITPADALAHISQYLTASETNPHLHPDAQLDPREIKFSTTGGPSGGLVLHNLRRVEKGLNGEVLAPEPDELEDMFRVPGGDDSTFPAGGEVDGGARLPRKGGLKRKSAYDTADLQDPVEYAQSQTALVGEVGERDTAGGQDVMDIDMDEGAAMSQRDKEARKEEKKRRRKAEQREKEMQKANK